MQELFSIEKPLTIYDEFRAQLAQWKQDNDKMVFDYEDPKGNKDARSHVYKMRQSKAAVEKARKNAKQAALDYGRIVDSEAKDIIGEIESMIDVHQKPLDEIEQREKDRIAKHESKISIIQAILDTDFSQEGADVLKRGLADLLELEPNESFEEFTGRALSVWKQAKSKIEQALSSREKYEAEQAELARLRAEQEARERKEREEQIAREAAEKARAEAEARAKAEREAAARREAEAKAAQERAEQARIAAEEKAKREAIEAVERQKTAVREAEERAKREAAEQAAREQKEAELRETNKKHAAKIHNEALAGIMAEKIMDENTAKAVIALIAKGQVPHIKIIY